MVGWHYTSYRNWLSIKENGLIPNEVNNVELLEYYDVMPRGTWVWTEEPEPTSELGSILHHAAKKAQLKVVKLQVTYTLDDLLYYERNGGRLRVQMNHVGTIENWEYHRNQQAVILVNPIPISQIKLIKTFDLMDVVK